MASIIKRPDRPLPYFVYWREPGTKAQRAKAFATKREAEAFRDTVSTELRHGTYTDRRPLPFKTFAEDWLQRTTPTVSPNTRIVYRWALKYLVAGFGLTPIQNLTAEAIERWQAARLAKGRPGPRSVAIFRAVLSTILKDARLKGRLFCNPMEAVRRFDVPTRELHYLTAPQTKALCEKVGRVHAILFMTLGLCGLRISEALGLQWPDLDLTRRHLFVQRQARWRRKRECQAGQTRWYFAEPKSKAGIRVVEIPGPLVPFLVAHREAQNGGPNPLGLVFPSEAGTPIEPGNVRRVFAPAVKALGLPGIRPHDFRRTFVALHVEAGTHAKQIQERLGHADVATTMDIYGKVAGKMQLGVEQAARFNNLASATLGGLVNTWSTGASKTGQNNQSQPEGPKAISA